MMAFNFQVKKYSKTLYLIITVVPENSIVLQYFVPQCIFHVATLLPLKIYFNISVFDFTVFIPKEHFFF